MEISPLQLFWLLICSVLLGAISGVLNDFHRLTRIFFGVQYSKKRFDRLYQIKLPLVNRSVNEFRDGKIKRVVLPILIFFQDVFLFCFSGIGCVILNYYFNNGQFRFYTIPALLLGFAAYYFTVGRLVMLISELLIFGFRAIFLIVGFVISRPFALFVKFFRKIVKKIYANVKKTIAKKQKMVYNIDKLNSVLQNAERGFLDIRKF